MSTLLANTMEHIEIYPTDQAAEVTALVCKGKDFNIPKLVKLLELYPNLEYLDIGRNHLDAPDDDILLKFLQTSKIKILNLSQLQTNHVQAITKENILERFLKVVSQSDQFTAVIYSDEMKEKYPFLNQGNPCANNAQHPLIAVDDAKTPLQCAVMLQAVQKGEIALSPDICRQILHGSSHNGVISRLIVAIDQSLQQHPENFAQYRDILRGIYQGRKVTAPNMEHLVQCINRHFPQTGYNKEDYDFYIEMAGNSNHTVNSVQDTKQFTQLIRDNMPADIQEKVTQEIEQKRQEMERWQKAERERRRRMAKIVNQIRLAEIKEDLDPKNGRIYLMDDDKIYDQLAEAAGIVFSMFNNENQKQYTDILSNLLKEKKLYRFLPSIIESNRVFLMQDDAPELADFATQNIAYISHRASDSSEILQSLSRVLCKSLLITSGNTMDQSYYILNEMVDNPSADGILLHNTYEDLEKVYLQRPAQVTAVLNIFDRSLKVAEKQLATSSYTDHLSTLAAIIGDTVMNMPEIGEQAYNILHKLDEIIQNAALTNKSYIESKISDAYAKIKQVCPQFKDRLSAFEEQRKILNEAQKAQDSLSYLTKEIVPLMETDPSLAQKICDKMCEKKPPYISDESEAALKWNIYVLQKTDACPPTYKITQQLLLDYVLVQADKNPSQRRLFYDYRFLLVNSYGDQITFSHNELSAEDDLRILHHLTQISDDLAWFTLYNYLSGCAHKPIVDEVQKIENLISTGLIKKYPNSIVAYIGNSKSPVHRLPAVESATQLLRYTDILDQCDSLRDEQEANAVNLFNIIYERLQNADFAQTLDKNGLHRDFAQIPPRLLNIFNRKHKISDEMMQIYLHAMCNRPLSFPFQQEKVPSNNFALIVPEILVENLAQLPPIDAYSLTMPPKKLIQYQDGITKFTVLSQLRRGTSSDEETVLRDFPEICNYKDYLYAIRQVQSHPEELPQLSEQLLKSVKFKFEIMEGLDFPDNIPPNPNDIRAMEQRKYLYIAAVMEMYDQGYQAGTDSKDLLQAIYKFRFNELGAYNEKTTACLKKHQIPIASHQKHMQKYLKESHCRSPKLKALCATSYGPMRKNMGKTFEM